MNLLNKVTKDEQGSATIEFLGIIPVALLLLVVLWQFILGIHGVVVTQSAVNEYASVYSITKDKDEARAAAQKILDTTGDHLSFSSYVTEPSSSDKEFTIEIAANINLVVLPVNLFGGTTPSIDYHATTYSRVIE
ncbi:TadE-like protein [Oceanobacillus limi]|uniref:TadE-like protein n=1 Tax=Oceanobacillus limi TaxID=930131 RepID=A0A1I0DQ97_9BACI|nr:hypothetical protein [Oceanobacillus limi]SET34353.1 TadE-like protein [Oceanobacillus limi]